MKPPLHIYLESSLWSPGACALKLFTPLIDSVFNWSKCKCNWQWRARYQGILKGGSITVPLTSCLTGLESAVWQQKFLLLFWLIQTSTTGQRYSDTSPLLSPAVIFTEELIAGIKSFKEQSPRLWVSKLKYGFSRCQGVKCLSREPVLVPSKHFQLTLILEGKARASWSKHKAPPRFSLTEKVRRGWKCF
jgi:hypothetical protein